MIISKPWLWGPFLFCSEETRKRKLLGFLYFQELSVLVRVGKPTPVYLGQQQMEGVPVAVSLKICSLPCNKDQGCRGMMLSLLGMAILPILTTFSELGLRAGNWGGGRNIHKDAFSHLLYRQGRDVFLHSNSSRDLEFRLLKWMMQNIHLCLASRHPHRLHRWIRERLLSDAWSLAFANTPRTSHSSASANEGKPEMIPTPVLTHLLCLCCWTCSGP